MLTEAFFTGEFPFDRRCRAASNMTTAPAADTFSDDTWPAMGIFNR